MSTCNQYFEQKYETYSENFYLKFFIFLVVKFSVFFNRLVFVIEFESASVNRAKGVEVLLYFVRSQSEQNVL